MSSRTGQRGPSLSTSQRKHRSRSAPRYDLEKKPKKKEASGTSSLVSIPNSIKLTMLNSGLISFASKVLCNFWFCSVVSMSQASDIGSRPNLGSSGWVRT
ncbi:unnamed protein product [Pieris macdunnoughi]|uniref:Uncharacterized protein n=1 Tax=Pieris macdunnoughi TaxID=345717 RepID=A0A821PKN7_9NEOP|nr:unnamed protein product [Pieris macdunnoughi]